MLANAALILLFCPLIAARTPRALLDIIQLLSTLALGVGLMILGLAGYQIAILRLDLTTLEDRYDGVRANHPFGSAPGWGNLQQVFGKHSSLKNLLIPLFLQRKDRYDDLPNSLIDDYQLDTQLQDPSTPQP